MNTIVQINDVTKKFGTLTALDGVGFSIPEHSIFGVLGPNGAGKTTLFSCMAGFLRYEEGEIVIFGENDPEKLKGKMSILPQDALFQSNIPIIDQLTFFLRLMGRTKRDAVREVINVLELVDLMDVMERESATLSHGMYKRLALAQAFLGNPDLIILDEPTSGLDFKSAKQIRELIKKLKAEATVLVSSHNMQEMRELTDHIAIINKGKLVKVGPVEEVTGSSYALECTLNRELSPDELGKIKEIGGIENIDRKSGAEYSMTFYASLSPENVDQALKIFFQRLADFGVIMRAMTEKNKLEDEYLKLTGQ